MQSLSVSFIKVNIGLFLMMMAYVMFLRKEKYFTWNRVFLLFALLVPLTSLVIPGLEWHATQLWPSGMRGSYNLAGIAITGSAPLTAAVDSDTPDVTFSVLSIIWMVYGGVCLFLVGRFGFRLIKICGLIRSCDRKKVAGIVLCSHSRQLPAFSFFRWIVINPVLYEAATFHEIVEHEKVHCRSWHSADILLADLIQSVFWINPAAAVIKKYLKLNLEFTADEEVVATGLDRQHYQYSLLQHCLMAANNPLVNAFHSSKIKRRIYMMNSTRSTTQNLYRFAFVLPFIFITYLAVSPVRADNGSHPGSPETVYQAGLEGYYQLDKDSTAFVFIHKKDGKLMLKQMWDGMEFPFEEKTALTYYNAAHSFPLAFTKGANGQVTSMLAFDRDTWIKTNRYKEQKAIALTAQQLQRYAGKYSMTNDGKELVLEFAVKGTGIEVTETWRKESFMILPESEKSFFGKSIRYPVEFSFDGNGNVTQALIYHHDVWKKM